MVTWGVVQQKRLQPQHGLITRFFREVILMEKTIQLTLKTPRLLRFVSEGHHKKASRPYADPMCNFGGAPSDKPVVGLIAYSYSVNYSWIPQFAYDPASARTSSVSCPCGVGL